MARGDVIQAQDFADQCLNLATQTNSQKYVVRGQRLQGEIALAQQQSGEAEKWLRQALLLARSVGNPTQLWRTYLSMGHLYRARKQWAQAQEYYQAACDVIYRIKSRLQNAELRESLEHSPLIQQIYHFRVSEI